MTRKSFFAALLAPVVARFAPKGETITVSPIMRLDYRPGLPFTPVVAEALDFYRGNQWPAAIKHAREIVGRPVLVHNKIAGYVNETVNQMRLAGKAVSDSEREAIIVDVVRKHRDEQMLHNLMVSNLAEAEALRSLAFRDIKGAMRIYDRSLGNAT